MQPDRHDSIEKQMLRIGVDRTPSGSIDDASFRRLDDALSVFPWGNWHRIDFEAIGATQWPWTDDDESFLERILGEHVRAFEEVVVLLSLRRPDQPAGYVLSGRSLLEQLDDLEISDAVVLPLVGQGDDWNALLAPAMWVEVGSNVWIWGELQPGQGWPRGQTVSD